MVTHLRFVADHDVILHGVGDVVDSEHQASTIFDTGKTRTCPRHHVAGSVLSMNRPHVRLRETDRLQKNLFNQFNGCLGALVYHNMFFLTGSYQNYFQSQAITVV